MDQPNTSKIMEERVNAYHASLKEWDAKLDQLDARMRIKYEQERDRFSRELAEAWQDLTAAKFEEYLARIEGSFQNLKARVNSYFTDAAPNS